MSELKVLLATPHPKMKNACDGAVEVYLKPEADKVIAELKEQVHDYALGLYVIQAKAEKEARHQKYKRCLAIAKWCLSKCSFLCSKCDFYCRWHKRWLELAAKFKEAK